MDFAILRLGAGEWFEETSPHETAWVLFEGEAEVGFEGRRATTC
jgi:hypothetical protein